MIAKAVQADVVRAEVSVILAWCAVVAGNGHAGSALALSRSAWIVVLLVAERPVWLRIVVALAGFAIVVRAFFVVVAVHGGVGA
jgi:hypothetical protein